MRKFIVLSLLTVILTIMGLTIVNRATGEECLGFGLNGAPRKCSQAKHVEPCTPTFEPDDQLVVECAAQGGMVCHCGCHSVVCDKKIERFKTPIESELVAIELFLAQARRELLKVSPAPRRAALEGKLAGIKNWRAVLDKAPPQGSRTKESLVEASQSHVLSGDLESVRTQLDCWLVKGDSGSGGFIAYLDVGFGRLLFFGKTREG